MVEVSIIIPVYNSAKTINRAVESCLNQTLKDIEILVVDNLSTDNTSKIVSDISAKDDRVKLISLSQKGRSIARNAGLDQANGKYIQFLDADDTLKENKLKISVAELKNDTSKIAFGMSVEYISDTQKKVVTPSLNFDKELLVHNIFPINTFVFKKTNIRFDEKLEYNEDWLFWVEVFKSNTEWDISQNIGCNVYVTGENTMSDLPKMIYYETFVRSIIKDKFPTRTTRIFVTDLKKVIMIVLLEEKRKISTDEAKVIYVKFSFLSYLAKFLIRIPFLQKKFSNKLDTIVNKSIY